MLEKNSNQKLVQKSLNGIVMLTNPPIGNQGIESSCVGWATGYAALGILNYPKYSCWDLAKRSPEYVYNQIKASSDCTSGAYLQDGLNLVCAEGACSWNMMPYTDQGCSVMPNAAQEFEASHHSASSWSAFSANSVSQIKQSLDLGYPVVIGFNVYDSFYTMWNNGGIWTTPNSGQNHGGHAVCIVGYDDNQQMFKVQNSWGLGGAQGFFWVTYNLVLNNVFSEAYILSGMNTSYAENIRGPLLVCQSGSTFTLNNLHSNCYITWNSTSNLTLTSAYSNIANYAANSSGTGWVQATINSSICGTSYTIPQKNLDWVGTPLITITGPYEGCPNTQYTFQAHTVNPTYTDPFSYSWTISPYDGYISTSNGGNYAAYAYITFYNVYSANGYDVMARAQNSCGTGEYGETNIWIHDCYYFMLSPNPASESVTVSRKASANSDLKASSLSTEELSKVFSVKVLDIFGNLHYSTTRSGEEFTIPTQNLKEGNYFVQISDKGKIVSNLQLVIKR